MIDTDHAEREVVGAGGELDGDGGFAESGVDVVDWYGVMWVCRVAGDVADDAEFAGVGC